MDVTYIYSMDYTEPYLAHHGIKGQRWGVRRFQNVDGSYTSEGRKRHANMAIANYRGNSAMSTRYKAEKYKAKASARAII